MSRWGVAKQEKLTAGAVRCGTARMPDPMLVPTINATAPATLPLRAPRGGATAPGPAPPPAAPTATRRSADQGGKANPD